MRQSARLFVAVGLALLTTGPALGQTAETPGLYAEHCAACHGAERLGAIGPALLPGNLKRLRPAKAESVIANGRAQTQMPAFGDTLSAEQISALAKWIYQPPTASPRWDWDNIVANHVELISVDDLPDQPQHNADPLNLFVVVESGDHHVSILDGDRMEPITRFKSRFALHGGPKFSPSGRFVYFGSRDGWVTKYDLHSMQIVAEIRAGINMRNIAVSSDGQWVIAGNYLPHSLVILHAEDLRPYRVVPVTDDKGNSSRVSAVYNAPPRQSFVVALKDIKEIWELSYDPEADPILANFVHNYRKGEEEGIVVAEQPFGVRRIATDDYLDDFFFDPSYAEVIGSARDAGNGQVVNLDARRKVTDLALSGLPHLGSGITWQHQGRTVMATPHLKDSAISVIDLDSWETLARLETLGPGFFMRSHENSPYAWVDVFFGPDKDAVHVIDKTSLEIVKTLRPAPGKTSAHVEFTRDGRFALLSIWDMDGEIVVYDSHSLQEVKRIPFVKPSGKYNVYNKINLSEGTSH